MSTSLDYLRWRGDLPFDSIHPLNSVDASLFASISYLPIDHTAVGHTLGEAASKLAKLPSFQVQMHGETATEILLLPQSPRFGEVKILDWTNRMEKDPVPLQFNAATFRIDSSTILITYRGTDSTMIGWNEDFNMNYMPEVYGQDVAASYLKDIAARFPNDRIYLTGHSKGGNFACYALSVVIPEIQDRVIRAYNFDGPGFYYQVASSPSFQRAMPKMKTYIPESSTIGTMLDHPERTLVVKCTVPFHQQHDPRRWSVGRDSFVLAEGLSPTARMLRHALIHFNHTIPVAKRSEVFPSMFDTFENYNIKDVNQFGGKLTGTYRFSRILMSMDPEVRQVLLAMFGDIWESYRKNIAPFGNSLFDRYPKSNDSKKAPVFFEFYDPKYAQKQLPAPKKK
ncbi:DUF2974 domain-containing protein [Lactobacillus corticis]|uniref:Esterase n=1 Tax=Lactobacillus corticis TaxID=2201249 RepID=A0A916VHQ1_9LACO|nr:DUF2974 domain-containing protein [Lactobacillus corticis]GFZ26548.1 esterase [Lactobacillus corticis]